MISACVGAGSSSAAVIRNPTAFAVCTSTTIPPGSYVVSTCQQGDAITVGSNRITTACNTPQSGQYVSTVCKSGSNSVQGSNSVVKTCSITPPSPGFYIQSACIAGDYSLLGSDVMINPCTMPLAGAQYVAKICAPGSIASNTAGSDALIYACSTNIPTGSYVSATCIAGSLSANGQNLVTSKCATPQANQYVASACSPGSVNNVGTNSVVRTCSLPGNNYYVSKLCTQGSVSGPAGNDATITPCGPCPDGQNMLNACFAGTYNVLGNGPVCTSNKNAVSNTPPSGKRPVINIYRR